MGDSPILALCAARGRVWVGFQIGHLLIFDSSSHHLLAQIWLRQYTPIVSIVHVPHHRRVFVTLATGSVFAYKDEVEGEAGVRRMPLQPVCEYHDLGQPASCVTAVPRPPGEVGGASHELWVGQSETMITILDPRDLSVVKFLRNTSDKSPTPSYMAYLTYTNLVYSSHLCTVTQTQVRLDRQPCPTISLFSHLSHSNLSSSPTPTFCLSPYLTPTFPLLLLQPFVFPPISLQPFLLLQPFVFPPISLQPFLFSYSNLLSFPLSHSNLSSSPTPTFCLSPYLTPTFPLLLLQPFVFPTYLTPTFHLSHLSHSNLLKQNWVLNFDGV